MPKKRDTTPVAEEVRRGERRLERALGRFAVKHLNNTKWREIVTILDCPGIGVNLVHLKFVDEQEARDVTYFRPVNDEWTDSSVGPFKYREIEWLEVPGSYYVRCGSAGTPRVQVHQNFRKAHALISGLGKMPLVIRANGFRIVGYGNLDESAVAVDSED